MESLEEKLAFAIHLRESQQHEQARAFVLSLHSEYPNNPQVNYQCAWIHDLLGLEHESIPFYKKAIQTGLNGKDLQGALLSMGSTYRCIGEYQKAKELLLNSLAETSRDEGIIRYQRAIRFYADKLDEIW